MNTLTPFYITGYSKGLQNNKKPYLLPDQAWSTLENEYTWRERELKREGNTLLGRLQRNLTAQSLGTTTNNVLTYTFTDIFTTLGIRGNEEFAELRPSTLVITIGAPDNATFTSQPDGTFLVTGVGVSAGSYVSYASGTVVLILSAATGGAAISAAFSYYPSLPGMGIWQRDQSAINTQQTIWWDQRYAYIYSGGAFSEFIPGTTWTGSDSQFFWAYNYQAASGSRILFETNFNKNDPMYYTDGSTWTPFTPIITATTFRNENDGTVTTPWTTFTGTLANTPVLPGTVTIRVGSVTFTDSVTNGILTGSPPSNTGVINYVSGVYTLNFSPALLVNTAVIATYSTTATSFLFTARILIPYFGRLVALNTWEGATTGAAINYFNRARFSGPANADPTRANAWRADIFGLGGSLDAPVQEQITGATFVKNTLVVDFEYSTWQLRYVGEYGLPFIWERISIDFGSGSTFSGVLFDNERLAIGDVAITTANAVGVNRIDLDIPDQVFDFQNNQSNNGSLRVWGIRNYEKELVYWNYPDANDETVPGVNITYPNKVLLFNYRNKTYAIFRDNVTAFGTFQIQTAIDWDNQQITWDDENVTWDDPTNQIGFPQIVKLNQEGFAHLYASQTEDDPSLSVTGVAIVGGFLQLTIPNHNLMNLEVIYLQGLRFIDSSTFLPVTTSLNNTIYEVYKVVDANTIQIAFYNTNQAMPGYVVLGTSVGTWPFTPVISTSIYVGGGTVTLFPRPNMITKDINLYQQKGMQTKLSRLDFLIEPQPNDTAITVNIILNSAPSLTANLSISPPNFPTNFPILNNTTQSPGDEIDYRWFSFYQTLSAQYFRIQLTYSDALMNTLTTHQSHLTLYAINAWTRPGGRLVAGGS